MKWLTALVASLALTGCACGEVPAHYVDADESTREVIAPMLRDYVDADETLADEDKKAVGLLLDSWKSRIDAAKEGNRAE